MNKNHPTNYVLIDFENVQPKNLELLSKHLFKVIVFVGATQTKVPYELVEAMQRLGENAQYIKISGTRKDALDFHIAFYIGELATKDPEGYFHIISKDTGFDPLIKHLKDRKFRVLREKTLAEIPILRTHYAVTRDEKIEAIVKNLIDREQSRPRKEATLSNTINMWFTKQLEETELSALIKELQTRKYIVVGDAGKITYTLPKKDMVAIPILQMNSTANRAEKIAAIVKNLAGRGQSRPRKEKTLANTIQSVFTEQLADKELSALIQNLRSKKYITVKDGNVSYNLQKTP